MSSDTPSSTTPETSMITDQASIDALNRGPVTTFWEPSSTCTNTLSLDDNMYYGFGAAGVVDTACYPMGTMKYKNFKDYSSWGLYYYSPAICPNDWTRVTTYTDGGIPHRNGLTTMSVSSGTTAMLCCPSGFKYAMEGHVCTSAIPEDSVIKYVVPQNDPIDTDVLQIGDVKTSTYAAASWAYAAGVVVMFQSSDTAILRSATVNPTAAVSSTATSVSGSTRTSTTATSTGTSTSGAGAGAQESSSSSGGLSTGAKIGMGVGIPLALLIGLAFGFLLFRRRRSGSSPPPGYDEAGMTKYAHLAQVHEAHSEPPELGGNPMVEGVPSERKVPAANAQPRHELM